MSPSSFSNGIQVDPVPWANEKDRNRYIENDRSKFLTAEDYYNNKYPKRDVTTSKVEPDRKAKLHQNRIRCIMSMSGHF